MDQQTAYQIRQLSGQIQNLQGGLANAHQENQILRAQVASQGSFFKEAPIRPKWLEDIHGPRTPRIYTVEVPFTDGDTAKTQNSAEIAPDGPFIITDWQAFWRVTDTDDAAFSGTGTSAMWIGRHLPISAHQSILNQAGAVAPGTMMGTNLIDFPEISLEIEVAGSGRFWTNQKVPGAAFQGVNGNPGYVGIHGWVERTDRLVVHGTPERAAPHDGRLVVVFNGYQILAPISIAEALNLHGGSPA